MWNERRGWHDDTATGRRRATSPRRLSMLEILTRQRQQAERISAEDARGNPRAISRSSGTWRNRQSVATVQVPRVESPN
jgi:hypothetical protein